MDKLCAGCTICPEIPPQASPRVLAIDKEGPRPLILVIDDVYHKSWYASNIDTMSEILGANVDFTYTTAIRCNYPIKSEKADEDRILSRCSVWTNSLLEGRALIITTKKGLVQLKLEEREEGSMFKTNKYGLILVIPPLSKIAVVSEEYKTKAKRLLKEIKYDSKESRERIREKEYE